MKLAIIQVEAHDLQDYRRAFDRLERIVREAADTHDLIMVPECALPAYYLHDRQELELALQDGESFLRQMKELARQKQVYIAYGYAEASDTALYNTALLIDRQGEEAAKKRKSFLWHFDSEWFSEGDDVAVVETDFGKVALVVCADARSPEIVRLAALEGADMIVDLANLTATGPDIGALQNAQSAYMLSVRAMENRMWLAVSDKWGVEADSITYAGRSGVFRPDGSCMVQAGSDSDEVISVELPVDAQGKLTRDSANHGIRRRPELYKLLTAPGSSLPVSALLQDAIVPAASTPYVAAAAGAWADADSYLAMVQRLVAHKAGIVCMPPCRMTSMIHIEAISAILPDDVLVAATFEQEDGAMVSYLLSNQGTEAVYHTLHHEASPGMGTGEGVGESVGEGEDVGAGVDASAGDLPVFATRWGNIGFMHDKEAMLPEWPRTLMLQGADCLIWPNHYPRDIAERLGRTRAAENRIFVVSVQSATTNGGLSQIIDPGGVIVASTLLNRQTHACGALVALANSRIKEVVPGTNVALNRHPEQYGKLAEESDLF